ncbi:MAG: hypothetical protein R2771_04315 [Saprospiraceae bacterium]
MESTIGLLVTSIATLIITNLLNIESISIAGSIGFLLIFAFVNYAGFRLSKDMNSKKTIHLIGFFLCEIAIVVLLVTQFSTNKTGVLVSFLIILTSFVAEWYYRKIVLKDKAN